jgi:tritrans,polycis-undecaprenyl-diphosphate synthase [geranylgeranyl-diphosphate specific]
MNQTPSHIAIILDGNRRYAKKLKLNVVKGHEFGVKKVDEFINWCLELKIRELTLYTFSTENFHRNKQEVDYLMRLFKKYFSQLKKNKKFRKYAVRINFIGRLNLFSENIQGIMQNLMEETKNNKKLIINFAMGYGGRSEIIDGIKRLITDIRNHRLDENEITEERFKDYLYLHSEPEIIIRTGGEIRISNFLLYQSAYSEWFFLKKLWPEITKRDIMNVIEEYKKRERRFGS